MKTTLKSTNMLSKTLFFGLCISFLLPVSSYAEPVDVFAKRKVEVSVSEQEANIYVDGKLMAKGSHTVAVPYKSCVNVRVELIGYLNYEIDFCYKKNLSKPPKSYFIKLQRDDAYDASVQTDIANVDIEIKTNLGKDQAWKLLNQIILNYLDVIEITDKETGYIRTAWQLKTFKQNTIRTRIIAKQSSDDPLAFKIKLISEESRRALTSVKSDELFREWDRVLRKYKDVISEAQSRL
ncbi:MAG: hypothetical protein ABJM06_09050 [Gilvibacter sp.]